MNNTTYSILIILIIASVTALIRFMPFILFRKRTPKVVNYLGTVLPFAVMGMLVVYCLKNVSITAGSHGIPEAVSILFVIIIHKLKHNTLLSILAGTVIYMVLIQLIF